MMEIVLSVGEYDKLPRVVKDVPYAESWNYYSGRPELFEVLNICHK